MREDGVGVVLLLITIFGVVCLTVGLSALGKLEQIRDTLREIRDQHKIN